MQLLLQHWTAVAPALWNCVIMCLSVCKLVHLPSGLHLPILRLTETSIPPPSIQSGPTADHSTRFKSTDKHLINAAEFR